MSEEQLKDFLEKIKEDTSARAQKMTPARDPKQNFLRSIWKPHGGKLDDLGGIWAAPGILEASGRHLGGIHLRYSPLA